MQRLLRFWPQNPQTTQHASYELFVAQMASSMAVRELRAMGISSQSTTRNVDRGAAAAASAVTYDVTRDPIEYARPIAGVVVHTVTHVL
jgi:hypothetical protein